MSGNDFVVWGVFLGVLLTWGFQAVYFSHRWTLRRKPQSLAIALACLGWPVVIARELGFMRARWAAPLMVFALAAGALGALIILRWEAQRPDDKRWR